MFDNIGGKIKILATIVSTAGAVLFIFAGAIFLAGKSDFGIIILIFGPIISWLSSWILYGFGELIEQTKNISKGIKRMQMLEIYKSTLNDAKVNDETIKELQNEIIAEYKKDKENLE